MIQNDQATTDDVDVDSSDQSLELSLCLYGGKIRSVKKHYSTSLTLDELHKDVRRTFEVDSDKESMLWIDNKKYRFSQDGVLTPSKSENNVQSFSWASTTPPVAPPMPSSPIGQFLKNNSSPNVVTRQAANSINNNTNKVHNNSLQNNHSNNIDNNNVDTNSVPSITLTTSTSESPINSTSDTKEAQESVFQTLSDCGVKSISVVTLEVMNNDGTWPSSRPRFGTVSTRSSKAQPGLCGLSNMGNTCFMNSALQCLSNTPHLTNYILTDKFIDDINTSNPLGMHGEIARTYSELIKSIWSGNHSSFLPREFKCAVSRFAPQFNGFNQQDCQELMAFLLDGLHEDLNRIRDKPYIEISNSTESRPDEIVAQESWDFYKKRNDSIVVDTFHALLKSTLVCPGCNLVSVTFDPFCYLSLPLPVKRDKQSTISFFPATVSSSTSTGATTNSTSTASSSSSQSTSGNVSSTTTSGDATSASAAAASPPSSSSSASEPSSTSTLINKTNSADIEDEDEENSSTVAADISSTNDKVETTTSTTTTSTRAASSSSSINTNTTTTNTTPKAFPKPVLQLEDCIAQFTSLERLGADDPWYCPKCKKHQQATKKFDIWSLPKILIIHLKRFSFSRSWRDKIDTLVEFPVTNLDMSKYALNPSQKKKKHVYDLIGVANHYGGLGGGHYTAFAKNFLQDAWYTFDDALVSPTSANSVVTRSAYVLFYQLQEDSS